LTRDDANEGGEHGDRSHGRRMRQLDPRGTHRMMLVRDDE
jgi:hypothetical protein